MLNSLSFTCGVCICKLLTSLQIKVWTSKSYSTLLGVMEIKKEGKDGMNKMRGTWAKQPKMNNDFRGKMRCKHTKYLEAIQVPTI